MGRKKKGKFEIIRKIIDSLKEESKSIYKLSKELNSNWDTIKNNIELLEELSIVETTDKKVTLTMDESFSLPDDTVAGIPISDEMRSKVYTIAKKVCKEWKKKEGHHPDKSHLQKSIVEVADDFPQLKIPRGWYRYGKMTMVNMKPNNINKELGKMKTVKLPINEEKLNNKISDVVDKMRNVPDLLDYQYSKYEEEGYRTKLKISNMLASNDFNVERFSNYLYELIFNFPLDKEDELGLKTISILKEAVSIMIEKAKKSNLSKPIKRDILNDMFKHFWKIYTSYNLLKSLEGDLGYNKKYAKDAIERRINFYIQDLDDLFENCASNCI